MDRQQPPIVADERTQLVGWYDLQRDMLEETARHAGHLDAIRELLDGTKSYI